MSNETTTTVQDEKTDAAMQHANCNLMSLLKRLDETDPVRTQTLMHHLYQSDTMARAGLWDAAANEACSALDALVDAVLRRVFDLSEQTERPPATSFTSRRRALFDLGVTGRADNQLLVAAFQTASCKDTKALGIDAVWSSTARRLVLTAATHLLARYNAWRERAEGTTTVAT